MADDTIQPTLLPEVPAQFVAEELPLDQLPPDEAIFGGAPAAALVASIRRDGVLQPVLLIRAYGDGYWIAEGRRRIKAARAAGRTTIPAWIADGDRAFAAVLGLVTHGTRRDNPAAEVDAIQRLLTLGADERTIARETGLRLATIRQRLRLLALDETLREALRRGKLAVGTAEHAAKLPAAAQRRLASRLDAGERLTETLVADERCAQRAASAIALPLALLTATPGADALAPTARVDPARLLALVVEALRLRLGDDVALEERSGAAQLRFPDGAAYTVTVRAGVLAGDLVA
jgi:ParB/RepB/Spo0J family partition protein